MTPTVKSLVGNLCTILLIATLFRNDELVDVNAFAPSKHTCRSCQRKNKIPSRSRPVLRGDTRKLESNTDEQQPPVNMSSNDKVENPSYGRTNAKLSFPPLYNLMDVNPGEFVASEPFVCRATSENDGSERGGTNSAGHKFRVKLYPRGGGGGKKEPSSSSSLSDKLPRILQSRPEEVVGLYLQYLGREGSVDDTTVGPDGKYDAVNATFALRLKGRQQNERFDIEWRAGMRFVADDKDSNLNQGDATDFGYPLMQTPLLKDFLGIVGNDQMYEPTPVLVEAEVLIHNTALENSQLQSAVRKTDNSNSWTSPFSEDIRQREDGKTNGHDTERVRVGKIVVPVLSGLSQRPKMFEQGTYPGVEYRILRILKDGQERFTSCPGAQYELKPVYPLVPQLERQWPIRVKEEDIPKLYTPSMYNALSAFGSLFLAASGLFTAFLLSQAISLFFIPSRSMEPTLNVGDVLLVEKVSSRLGQSSRNKVGDIVLFSPPNKLQQIVASNGGNLSSRDLFVKRIAASAGDKVSVYKDGKVEINDENVVDGRRDLCEAEPLRLIEKYIEPSEDNVVEPKKVFVMGDCSSVSVDSRVWGSLESRNIIGRPIVRLWPLNRFGKVE